MKVLFVTSEFAGLAKAGGLGDVAAGLPVALRRLGVDIRVLLPAYRSVLAQLPEVTWIGRLPGRGTIPGCRIGEVRLPSGLPLYLVGAPALYDRDGTPYSTPEGRDWPDNHLRFARLSLAAADIARGRGGLGWSPDLLHAQRLAGRAGAGLYALGRHRGAVGDDHPQHRLPRQFPAAHCATAGHSGSGVRHQRRRVPWRGVVPQGRPAIMPTM